MDKSPGVDVVEGGKHLVEKLPQGGSLAAPGAIGQDPVEVAEEILPLKQFHGEVAQPVGRGAVVVDLHQVGVGMGGQQPEFIAGKGGQRSGEVLVEHLDGELAFLHRVEGPVDRPAAALAEGFENSIATGFAEQLHRFSSRIGGSIRGRRWILS